MGIYIYGNPKWSLKRMMIYHEGCGDKNITLPVKQKHEAILDCSIKSVIPLQNLHVLQYCMKLNKMCEIWTDVLGAGY